MSADEECSALSPQSVCIQSALEKRKLIPFVFLKLRLPNFACAPKSVPAVQE